MNNEEKILEMLIQMQEEQKQMREEQKQMREEQKQMRDDIAGLRAGQAQMQDDIAGLKTGQAQMQDDVDRIKLRLELDVEKRFDAVNEGIDAILEKLTPKSRVDELEADVIVLKTAVKALTQEVAELKRAQ